MISESGRGKKANAAKPALRKEVGMDRDDGISCYRRFLAGDRSGLEELLALYRRALVLFVNGYVRDAALAEDIAIDVFFELYKRKKPFDETRGAAFKTYLFRIARNKALNALRKRGRRREEPLTGAESAEGDPEDKAHPRGARAGGARGDGKIARGVSRGGVSEIFRGPFARGDRARHGQEDQAGV